MKFYNDNSVKGDNLANIYYYKYYYNKSNKKESKYFHNFLDKYINNNISYIKTKFKQRIKNYNISED